MIGERTLDSVRAFQRNLDGGIGPATTRTVAQAQQPD
jgi:hypothetical protein